MVVQDDYGMHLVEMLLVEVMEPVIAPGPSAADGSGA